MGKSAPYQLIPCKQMSPRPPCRIFRSAAGALAIILPVDVFKTAPLIADVFYFLFLDDINIVVLDLDLDLFLDDDRLINDPDHTASWQQIIFQCRSQWSAGIIGIEIV